MTVLDIVLEYLREHGYDGLYNDGECGCLIDDLEPCSNMTSSCMPGYKTAFTYEGATGWSIGPEKPKEDKP